MKTRKPSSAPAIGVDVGGVIVDRVAEAEDTSFFGGRPMETPAVDGALEGLATLLDLFEGRVYIVSKAGPKIAALTTQWLAQRGAIGNASVPWEHVHFVRRRIEKGEICRSLGITHFVDDRVDVLTNLPSVSYRYLFTGGLGAHPVPTNVPRSVPQVASWAALVDAVATTLRAT